MMQWKCGFCKNWISMDLAVHLHYLPADTGKASLDGMIAAREIGIDATDNNVFEERWTPLHETRKAPDPCPQ